LGRLTVGIPLDRLQSERRAFGRHNWLQGAALLVAFAASLLAGCASTGPGSQAAVPPVDSAEAMRKLVASRADARWQTLIRGDLEGAYQYLSAGSKAATSLDAYKRKTGGLAWRRVEVEKVECEAEICKVSLQLTYDTERMKGIRTPIMESWIIENGSAWFIYG
jgi:hypothetical protein